MTTPRKPLPTPVDQGAMPLPRQRDLQPDPRARATGPATPPASLTQDRPISDAAQAFLGESRGPRRTPRQIPLITIEHRGAKFILPSGELVDEVSGYPIHYFSTRRYYKRPPQIGAGGAPPDCWSADMVVPNNASLEKQHATCAGCPMNEFGTGRDGRSKACGQYTWVFLLNPDFGQPPLGVVVAPPSSLRALLGSRFTQGYFGQAAARHGVYEIVWTSFRLERMGDQVQYCVVHPVMGPALTDIEQARQLASVRNDWVKAMDELRGITPDVQAGGEE